MLGGRYRLGRVIGRGGMGEVFLAEDTVLGREVAVKHILAGEEDSVVATQRLLREARSAARIHHPHVVTVHDLVIEGTEAYIVMEYVPAENLAQVIRRGALAPERAARIGSQVASALAAAHALGIVHRDVKPSNILLSPGDNAKLTDFGVARVAGDTGLTKTGHLIGSVAYLPPEVARGSEAGPASDVYSLGATLFASVEGHAPFASHDESSTSVSMLVRLVTEAAPSAAHGGSIAGLIARMLAVEPGARPTALEVHDELITVAAALPVAPSQPETADEPDEEAAVETVLRPITPAPAAESAAAPSDTSTAAPAPESEESDTRIRPASVEPEPIELPQEAAHEDVSATSIRTPATAAATPPDTSSGRAQPTPASAPSSPKPTSPRQPSASRTQPSRPETPIERQNRRRRRAAAILVPTLVLAMMALAFAVIPRPADGPAAAAWTTPTASSSPSPSLPNPEASTEPAKPYDYADDTAELASTPCEVEGLMSIDAIALEDTLSVTVSLDTEISSDESVDVKLYSKSGDFVYYAEVMEDHISGLVDLDGNEVEEVDGSVHGDTIDLNIPLQNLAIGAPISVGAEFWPADGSDSTECSPVEVP